MNEARAGLTTHVLDTSRGRPAAGIPVRLEMLSHGAWIETGYGTTDADGRLRVAETIRIADYRLTFDVAGYLGPTAFYREISIQFQVRTAEQHHHVPLLLSPFGYSTYRGS